jgi:hypothetical protein
MKGAARAKGGFFRKADHLKVCSEWQLRAEIHLTEIFVLSVKTGGV